MRTNSVRPSIVGFERVKQLQKRGTPAHRILCMSFNRDAMVEIGVRLTKAGVEGAVVRSFHGMGLEIMKNEGKLRAGIEGLEDSVLENHIARTTRLLEEVTNAVLRVFDDEPLVEIERD